MKYQVAGIILAFQMASPAAAAMNPIQNPASNIYNPASRMDNPNPLTPPVPVTPSEPEAKKVIITPEPAVKVQPQQIQPKPAITVKNYNYSSARAYINAANKAYANNDIIEFLSITEEALIRINAGKIKSSQKSRQTLIRYKVFGHDLLNKANPNGP